jgi:hypothetical protein
MKWTGSRSLTLTRALTVFFMVCVVGCSVFIRPILAYFYGDFYFGMPPARKVFILSGLWTCALCALIALFMIGRLLGNIGRERVFIPENVRLVRYVSWFCFIIAGVYAASGGYSFGILFVALMGFIGLILRVVKNVLAQAVELKDENDLTV